MEQFDFDWFEAACLERGVTLTRAELVGFYEAIRARVDKKPPSEGVRAFLAAYCEAFRARYGTAPVVTGVAAGQARNVVKSLGKDRAIALVQAYLTMNDAWFLQKTHDLGTFVTNLNKVLVKAETGRSMTSGEIRNIERRETTANAFGALLRGKR